MYWSDHRLGGSLWAARSQVCPPYLAHQAVRATPGDGQPCRCLTGPRARRGWCSIPATDGVVRLSWAAGSSSAGPSGRQRAVRFVWLLDARTVRWSGGLPPGDIHRGVTGLNSEEAPSLWFRGSGGDNGQHAFTTSGAFGAAGIIESAQVSVTARIRRHCRLRMMVNPQMCGLTGCPGQHRIPGCIPCSRLRRRAHRDRLNLTPLAHGCDHRMIAGRRENHYIRPMAGSPFREDAEAGHGELGRRAVADERAAAGPAGRRSWAARAGVPGIHRAGGGEPARRRAPRSARARSSP